MMHGLGLGKSTTQIRQQAIDETRDKANSDPQKAIALAIVYLADVMRDR